jgi:hypothetical protein
MDKKLPEEDVIRRYLLGTLHEPELSEIEQKLRNSEELRETAELIEDEIIEQYLEKNLDQRDKKAVETYFLRSLEHREKLWFAGLLHRRMAVPALPTPVPAEQHVKQQVGPVLIPPVRVRRWRFAGAFAATAAASAILSVASTYLIFSKKLDDSQKAAAAAREQSAGLQARLDAGHVKLEFRQGISRAAVSTVPTITIYKTTDLINVDLLLKDPTQDTYRVALRETGQDREIWSQSDLTTSSYAPFSRLTFSLPTQPVKSGKYELVVTSQSRPGNRSVYPFYAVR